MKDFIIAGRGLAATVLAHTFHHQGISFHLLGDPGLSSCSRVAAGIFNPVVFKRMTASWLASETIPFLNRFYKNCEEKLAVKLITQRRFMKPFVQEQEKALWQKKAAAELKDFLDPEILTNAAEHPGLKMDEGYGLVLQAGNVDLEKFLDASSGFFREHILEERIDYNEFRMEPDTVTYKQLRARHVIFCEGYLVKDNPWFDWIPLKPVKGELLRIRAQIPELGDSVFNKDGFLLREHGDVYKLGATYDWQDLSEALTETGRAALIAKLEKMVRCAFRVEQQLAGVRPSSLDRRPIIGCHPQHENVFVFNGLGTKGVMLAPFFADNFVNFWRRKSELNPEVDVERFYGLCQL